VWWAVKGYADLTGGYVPVPGDGSLDGMASWDAASQTARVLLGNVGGTSSMTVRLTHGKSDPISLDTVSTTMTGAKEGNDGNDQAEADSWQ